MNQIINWKPLKSRSNLQASSLEPGHYCTGHPHLGWVLYSRGNGGCWNQRTEREFAPVLDAKPIRTKEGWKWKHPNNSNQM